MGGVHQDFAHGVCHAVWAGGDALGGRRLANGEDLAGGAQLLGGGEDGGDGFQPVGGLANRPAKSADGGAVDLGDEADGVADDGCRGGGIGGWSLVAQSSVSDSEPTGIGDCLFLFPDQEVHLGIPWIPRGGFGDRPGGSVAGGQGAV